MCKKNTPPETNKTLFHFVTQTNTRGGHEEHNIPNQTRDAAGVQMQKPPRVREASQSVRTWPCYNTLALPGAMVTSTALGSTSLN